MALRRQALSVADKSLLGSLFMARAISLVHAVLALPRRWRVGMRSYLALNVRVTGWRATHIGRNVCVGAGSWLNVNNRRTAAPSLILRDNAFIGRDNFFTVGRTIEIREYCLTASHCAFIGSSHVPDPRKPYLRTGTTGEDDIYVGVNCFLGFGVTVIGNVRIGHGSVIGAGTTVRNDVPPFSIVVGTPARVVKHYDFAANEWVSGERPAGDPAGFPDEEEYLRSLRAVARYPVQPLSGIGTVIGDV